jgi:DNA polymerase III, alpha subunit
MEYIPQFIARKHGKEPIVYDIPIMEKYLKDTYGITVYQEQVMLLSRLLANFTRGQSDGLRKAMGKKLKDKLDALKPLFISGGEKNGHKKEVLEKIWADWEKFASYAFNKSHATCYSWVAFQTAYLKANYPSEYMAAVLSRNLNNITEITKFMDECKSMKIQVLGPDVNESQYKFSVNKKGNIRFGLGAIKGVGDSAVQAIVKEREANGPYKGIFDFVERVNLSACGKKTIESLAISGAFDSFKEIHREDFTALNSKGEIFLETLVRYGVKVQNDKMSQATSLFGSVAPIVTTPPEIPRGVPLSDIERLDKERELVGMYLSAHPLDAYKLELLYGCNTRMTDLKDRESLLNKELTFGGVVVDYRTGIGKRGGQYGFLKIEDYSGAEDIPLFGQDFIDYGKYGANNGTFVWIKARCQPSKFTPGRIDLKILEIKLLSELKGTLLNSITIELPARLVKNGFIQTLSEFMPPAHQHKAELSFKIYDSELDKSVRLRSRRKPTITEELIDFLSENDEVSFKINE